MDLNVQDYLILEGYRGSWSHGTYVPSSDPNSIGDIDTMGVFIPPIEYYFGLHSIQSKQVKEGQYDRIYYEIRKFFHLLLKGNPNVVCMLWLRDSDYLLRSEWGNMLIANRNLFVSKLAFKSFAGYANAQMRKMEHFSFNGYMGKKRKELVQRFSFDIKNASHLIRLLHMCIDFLKTGEYIVYRPEREKLIDIKTGKWTLEQVKREAEVLFRQAEQEYEKCSLPAKPQFVKAEELLFCMIEDFLRTGSTFLKRGFPVTYD